MSFDAVVLAGGTGSRLGGVVKPQLEIGGVTLLDRVVASLGAAQRLVVVGPPQPVTAPVGVPLSWVREHPPGGGPVAGLAAALPALTAPVALVLAADLPRVGPAVPLLLAAVPADGVALLVGSDGHRHHLAAAWQTHALAAALAAVGQPRGAPMRALLRDVAVVEVPDADGWGRDVDTWADADRARGEQREH